MKIKIHPDLNLNPGRVATPLATVQSSTPQLELSITNWCPRKRHRRRVSLAVARGYFDLMRHAVDNAPDHRVHGPLRLCDLELTSKLMKHP